MSGGTRCSLYEIEPPSGFARLDGRGARPHTNPIVYNRRFSFDWKLNHAPLVATVYSYSSRGSG